jgi:microcystin-dependent protein
MSYQVRFTETNNPTKVAKIVEDQTLNTQTSVTFVGKNYAGYGQVVAENFLHLLENFANNTAPLNPVEGQVWFDNSPGVTQLKVWDGNNWTETGGVKKSAAAPSYKNIGDLWVDTSNQQLKVWTGASWVLVGPQFSEGSKTGFEVETFSDLLDRTYSVLTCYVANTRIAIFSKTEFTPKGTVTGFPTINQGVTLAADSITNVAASNYKFFGTAKRAENLLINNLEVAASNFLRTDQTSITNYNLFIKDDGGITIGADSLLSLKIQDNAAVIYNKLSGSSIDLQINNLGTTSTVLRIDSSTNVGINNTNPQEALDVTGNITGDGTLTITGDQDATSLSVASFVTQGGAAINKKLIVGGDTTINGTINISPTSSVAILPSTTGTLDIGSSAKKFNNVYANTFVGNFSGAFTGSLASNTIAGSAQQLATATSFYITGDVLTTAPVVFNGVTENQTATFDTRISETFFTRQSSSSTSSNSDELLVYRSLPTPSIKRVTKEVFFGAVATIPIGGIMPFAGSVVPNGFLLCDGSEIPRNLYAQLFAVIGYTYKDFSQLIGYQSFALPDLRGRFPLGKDSMENLDPDTGLPRQITTKASGGTSTPITTDAGGGSADRVTSSAADQLGAGTGSEDVTLGVTNLPDHVHNLRGRRSDGSLGAQYYAYRNATGTPVDLDVRLDFGATAANTAHYLPNSGGVDSAILGEAINTMNPYLTLNYIIYTGVLS